MTMRRVVTIDGPAGAGKSTVARQVAERLGWRFLDTGAMYRVMTLAALRSGIDLTSDSALRELANRLNAQFEEERVLLDGHDVTQAIRDPAVTLESCHIAASPSVRTTLVAWQRAVAAENDTITEGRDQGTIVFPDAAHKFYLTASLEERARRRFVELEKRSVKTTFETVLSEIAERDARDQSREIAPMRPADDAQIVDTTGRSLPEVIDHLLACITQVSRQGR
jgi:cytidylate kinase